MSLVLERVADVEHEDAERDQHGEKERDHEDHAPALLAREALRKPAHEVLHPAA